MLIGGGIARGTDAPRVVVITVSWPTLQWPLTSSLEPLRILRSNKETDALIRAYNISLHCITSLLSAFTCALKN